MPDLSVESLKDALVELQRLSSNAGVRLTIEPNCFVLPAPPEGYHWTERPTEFVLEADV